jgi:HSP20 family protein
MEEMMANWDLFQELDQAFGSSGLGFFGQSFLPGIGTGGYPRINVSEDDTHYFIDALIPGVDAKDLDLNVMQRNLTLAGERHEAEDRDYTWHRHERGAGKFMRTIDLPANIDTSKVDAEYKNGVLCITLPKMESDRPKKISLKTS